MRHNKNKTLTPTILVIALSLTLTISCGRGKFSGRIIVSETSSDPAQRNFLTGDAWRYLPGSKIVAVDPERPTARPKQLTGEFYSACNPEISPDGKLMAFSAQPKDGDPWQIWILDLASSKKTQVTKLSGNCTDPAFLPGNRLVFSSAFTNDSLKSGSSLFTCKTDGSDLRRITFSPHQWFASHVLMDGRILVSARQLFPEIKKQQYMVLRPDGTKADLFYAPDGKNNLLSRPRETGNGKIVFVESSETDPENGTLVSISYKRPLHSRINLFRSSGGGFLSVFPEASGKFLVSWRKSITEKYTLCVFDPGTGGIDKTIFSDPGFNVVDAVVAAPYARPRLLPSEVDMQVKTGLIMCQDISVVDPVVRAALSSAPDYKRIEIVGLNSSLGVVEAAKDRSFYLKVKADTPFRLRVLDEKGNAVNESCDWIWLRPNERRGCVGCHEDHELAPENRIPLAVKSSPVAVPVHIVKVKEKSVELE